MTTAAAMNQIAPSIADTLGSSNAAQVGDEVTITPNSFTTQLALNETQGLVNGVLNKEVDKQNFNLEIISAQALGSTIGQDIGQGAINSWKSQTSYQSAQNASNGGTSAQNPGSNPNSMFGKSANTGSNNAAQTNVAISSSASSAYGSGNTVPTSAVNNPTTSDSGQANNLSWLTSSPDQLLTAAGVSPATVADPNSSSILSSSSTFWNSASTMPSTSSLNSSSWLPTILPSTPLGQLAVGAFGVIAPNAVNWLEGYVAEHGSISADLSFGVGLAVDAEVGFSTKGLTMFGGIGAGLGANSSLSANYDLQDTAGFTSRTSIIVPLGPTPLLLVGSISLSQNGPAFSADVQYGDGLEIDTVVGYTTNTFAWDEVKSGVKRMVP